MVNQSQVQWMKTVKKETQEQEKGKWRVANVQNKAV